MSNRWCAVCGSRHDLGPRCPGEILATGTERFGWRIAIEAGLRADEFGVLIGPSNEIWLARILTFPNMLWSVPGGRTTMKFLGRTPTDAEARARNYILEVCRKRGFRSSKLTGPSKKGQVRPDGAKDPKPDERLLHEIEVKFGEEGPERQGTTGDLSMGGMSIVTSHPFPEGRRLKIVLNMESATLRLQGSVIWARTADEEDREPGMGIQLHGPPALYKHYVRRLTGLELDESEETPALAGAQPAVDG